MDFGIRGKHALVCGFSTGRAVGEGSTPYLY